MRRLGYERYVSQGGDWGAAVAEAMGRQAPPGLAGIHVNLPAGVLPLAPGFAQWTFGDDPDEPKTKDEVLDDITLYWLTNTATSSGRLYWENRGASPTSATAMKTAEISVPVGIAVFPEDVYRPPETWAQRAYPKLVCFHEVDRGGHFAAWEQPQLFAEELRAAFRSLR